MKDDLKKFGLRVRPRKVGAAANDKPGKIAFDDRGNAKFQWDNERLSGDGDTGERLRDAALFHPGLSMVEDEPAANAPIRSNPKGLRQGYNPYESGLLAKQEWKPKRNLRELSNWIETQRKRNAKPPKKD